MKNATTTFSDFLLVMSIHDFEYSRWRTSKSSAFSCLSNSNSSTMYSLVPPYFLLAPAVDATGTSLTIHVFLVIETLSLCNSAVLDDSNSTILQYTVHIKTSKIKVHVATSTVKFPTYPHKNSPCNTLNSWKCSKLSLNAPHKLHLAHESLVNQWLTIFEILSLG